MTNTNTHSMATEATAAIGRMIEGHQRVILQYSGGKDSTAMLHLARPFLDRIDVVFANAGAPYPHVLQFIASTCARLGAKLTIIGSDEPLEDFHARAGLPADVVPHWASPDAAWTVQDRERPKLQGALNCCAQRIFIPFTQHILTVGATLILRGAKKSDDRVGVGNGQYMAGVEVQHPLWDWTHDDVFAYLRSEGVELPAHYATGGRIDGLDCWSCTAHLPYGGAERLAWMKENTPDLLGALLPRLVHVRNAAFTELLEVDGIIRAVLPPEEA